MLKDFQHQRKMNYMLGALIYLEVYGLNNVAK